jgi:hypothetical protein
MVGPRRRQAVRAALPIVVVAALVSVPAAPAASAQLLQEGDDFLNTTYVGDEPETARLAFYKAEELLNGKQPKEAGREILKLLRSDTKGLVRYGERLVLPVETAALFLLLRLPEPVRAELAKEDEAAGDATLPAGADGSAALRAFALRHPLTAAGERAQLDAGVRMLLSGDAGGAAADLERLVHWPSAWPGATKLLAAARLLEAEQRSGGFADGVLTRWPRGTDAKIERAGAPIAIDELLAAARAAPPAQADPTFTPAFKVGWPLPQSPDEIGPELSVQRLRFLGPDEVPVATGDEETLRDLPTRAPLLLGDRIAAVEPDGLHVRSLADGRDLFAPLRFDFDLHLDPHGAVPVLDHAGLSAHGDRLWLTLELSSPVARAFDLFRRHDDGADPGEGSDVSSSSTALFGFDLARECYVDLAVTSADLARDHELTGYVLAGPAVESGGRLLVSASRLVGKETEVALLAFDARSGAPAGHLLLARAGNIPHYGDRGVRADVWRVVPSPAVLRDGVVYVCTNVGLMAAVRADDLGLVWGFRYHRRNPPDSEKFARWAQYPKAVWVGRPPIALADRVVATPTDSDYCYSFARWPDAAGHLVLNDPIERQHRRALIGANATTLFFVRRDGASGGSRWSIEATDHGGSQRWSSVPFPYGERIVGMPVLTERCLFVPTDHVVYPIQLAHEGGFCDRPISFPERADLRAPDFAGFGDLSVSGRWLVSTSALYTLVFEGAKE